MNSVPFKDNILNGKKNQFYFSVCISKYYSYILGNQSHAGQELNIDFKDLKSSPSALSIDYLTG